MGDAFQTETPKTQQLENLDPPPIYYAEIPVTSSQKIKQAYFFIVWTGY